MKRNARERLSRDNYAVRRAVAKFHDRMPVISVREHIKHWINYHLPVLIVSTIFDNILNILFRKEPSDILFSFHNVE